MMMIRTIQTVSNADKDDEKKDQSENIYTEYR